MRGGVGGSRLSFHPAWRQEELFRHGRLVERQSQRRPETWSSDAHPLSKSPSVATERDSHAEARNMPSRVCNAWCGALAGGRCRVFMVPLSEVRSVTTVW